MINGKNHSWEDIKIHWNGIEYPGITEINYSDGVKREFQRAAGRYPAAIGSGDYEASGDLTMHRADYNELVAVAAGAGRNIYDMIIPVITVSYGAKVEGEDGFADTEYTPTGTDRIVNVVFSKRDFGPKQGDTENTIKLEFLAGSIKSGAEK